MVVEIQKLKEYGDKVLSYFESARRQIDEEDGYVSLLILNRVLDNCRQQNWPLPEGFCKTWVTCGESMVKSGMADLQRGFDLNHSDLALRGSNYLEAGLYASGNSPVDNPYELIERARNPETSKEE
jgi:hypothetical protein